MKQATLAAMLAVMMLLHPLNSNTATGKKSRAQSSKQASSHEEIPVTMLLLKGIGTILLVPQDIICLSTFVNF